MFDALQLRRFGLARGDHVLLDDLTLTLPPRGLVHIVGAADAGKTTLGRVLARHDLGPSARHWGALSYGGIDWRIRPSAALIGPSPRLGTGSLRTNLVSAMPPERLIELVERGPSRRDEADAWVSTLLSHYGLHAWRPYTPLEALDRGDRRRFAIVRAVAAGSSVLVLDDIERDLDEGERAPLRELIGRLGEERLVLVLQRHPHLARALGGRVVVLSGGRLIEQADAADAWCDAPSTEIGRRLAAGQLPPAGSRRPPPPPWPAWFQWVLSGQLAGMPRPGRMAPVERDLAALREQGIGCVVTLEEDHHHRDVLVAAGFDALHVPIVDMEVPSPAVATTLAREVWARIDRGQAVALHCREGLGRTGTMLAVCLMQRGYSAADALGLLRSLRSHYVQSEAQLQFIEQLP